jgi:hypothetical protein
MKTPITRQTSAGTIATNRSSVTGSNKREHPTAEKEVRLLVVTVNTVKKVSRTIPILAYVLE